MKPLTIVYITSREKPELDWFQDSLSNQSSVNDFPSLIIVSQFSKERQVRNDNDWKIVSAQPKPTVWQGPHRLTNQDWWAAANARNTGIALCETDWIAFLDDRCVLMPGWLDSIKQAMEGNYAVFGSYEKRVGMTVENGQISNPGQVIGRDDREAYCAKFWNNLAPATCGGEWSYGCNLALPLEWVLEVNGFSEVCDGSGAEDVYFGKALQNSGHDCKFDYRMKVVQDRTPSELGTPMKKEDFGVSPNDYSHVIMNMHLPLKRAPHPFDIRDVRGAALRGEPWPQPWGPKFHGWDGKPLEEL